MRFGALSPDVGTELIGGTEIAVYQFKFKRWSGMPPPEHRPGNRCVLYGNDLGPYPELAICRGLRESGASQAVWAESMNRALVDWRRHALPMAKMAPPQVLQLLEDIHIRMGRPRFAPGLWEIVAWWDNPFRIHFCEVKGPRDDLRGSQIRWLNAALEILQPSNFSVCRYTLVD
jgi:hypothetical protein